MFLISFLLFLSSHSFVFVCVVCVLSYFLISSAAWLALFNFTSLLFLLRMMVGSFEFLFHCNVFVFVGDRCGNDATGRLDEFRRVG